MPNDFIVLSIITPTKNSASTITRFLNHLPFDYRSFFEVIIIDCLSSDETLNLVKKSENVFNFVVISESDSGIYDAMNKGAKIAVGDYLLFLNSDDWFEMESFNTFFRTLISKSHSLYVFQQKRWVTNYRFIIDSPNLAQASNRTIPHQCVVMSKALFNELGSFDLSYEVCSDYDLLLKAHLNKVETKTIDVPVVNFSTYGFSSRFSNLLTYYVEVIQIWRKHNLIHLSKILFFSAKTTLLIPKLILYKLSRIALCSR